MSEIDEQREFSGVDCTVRLVERPDAWLNWCLLIRGSITAESYLRGSLAEAQAHARRLILPLTEEELWGEEGIRGGPR